MTDREYEAKSGKVTKETEAYTYAYDKNSQIIRKTEKNSTAKDEKDHTDKTTEYTYNALGRLTKSVITDHKNNDEKTTTAYSYDSAGNRTKKVKGEEETSYTYNGLNQLLAAKTTKGETVKNNITYDYDVNGNQIKETDKETGDSVENTYDVENRLSKAVVTKKDKGSFTQENLYNGEGQRIQKKEGTDVTNYFYEDGMVSYTTGSDTGEKQIQNLSGLEDNVIYAEQKVSDTYQDFLYTKDIQGSTTSVLNKDTKGELSYEYDDFGETSNHGTSALKNEICYTGGIYDESTGLYYLNARYYDPENGRFLTEDTYRGEVDDPDTLHLYAYCKNNPINYVDPRGHFPLQLSVEMYLLALRKSATRNLAHYGAGITMRKRFMKSSIVKKRVKKYAKKAYKSKSKKYSKVEKVNFKGYTNIDLHLSIGHANYFKVAVVQKSAILGMVNFEVTISVKDIYDFKKMNKKDQNIIIVAVNNYLGYKPQSKGIIKKYHWKYTTKYHASFWKKELK